MNKFSKIGLAAIMVAAFAAPAYSQSNSATAASSATIIAPLSITNTTALLFGSVVKPGTGTGTVAINATTGSISVGGGVISAAGSTTGRATFAVAGDGSRTFSTTVPASFTLKKDGTASANDITVTLTSSVPSALSSGAATIGVGGSFSLAAAQVVGAYSGTFDVSVAYN